MSDDIWLSIVIPVYRDFDKLNLCLGSLDKQVKTQDIEIIIVDNEPEFIGARFIPFHFVSLIACKKKGSYAARNQGIAFSSGKVIAFLDADCIPREKWIEGIKILYFKKEFDRVAGNIKMFLPRGKKPCLASYYDDLFGLDQYSHYKNGWSLTANTIVKRDILKKAGGFSDEAFSGGDTEWGIRLTKLGFGILFSNEVEVLHPVRSSLEELIKKNKRTSGGAVFFQSNLDLRAKIRFWVSILLPPVTQLKRLFYHAPEYKLNTFLLLLFLVIFLKYHRTVNIFLIVFGIRNMERQ